MDTSNIFLSISRIRTLRVSYNGKRHSRVPGHRPGLGPEDQVGTGESKDGMDDDDLEDLHLEHMAVVEQRHFGEFGIHDRLRQGILGAVYLRVDFRFLGFVVWRCEVLCFAAVAREGCFDGVEMS